MKPDAAIIFAAGFGTRMGELTRGQPKPMLEVGGAPMIDRSISLLRDAGISRLFANTHYLADRIEPHLVRRGVTPLREDPILETGGGLKAAREVLACDPIITMNPDVLWHGPNPVSTLIDAWSDNMSALLLVVPGGDADDDFSLERGEIRRKGPYRYTGVQIVRTTRLDEIPDQVFSLNDYWDLLMDSGPLHGLVYGGSWTDIGTREALADVNRRLAT